MQTHTYQGKMFDVEYSSINRSSVYGILRLNSEFYEPEILKIRKKLISKNANSLGTLAKYIKRGIQPRYSNGNIKVLRSVNIREGGFSNDRQEYVDHIFYKSKKSGQIKYGDILLTSTGVGTLGRASINLSNESYFIDGHITAFRDLNQIVPAYLYTFLNSTIGQSQINKLYNGSSGQIEIYPDNLSEILIPIPSGAFQQKIEKLVVESHKQKEFSEKLYQEAEDVLLEEIGLKGYQTKTKTIKLQGGYEIEVEENQSITTFSQIKEADRFDAEYWDVRYEKIIETIKKYDGGYDNIGELIEISKKKIILNEEKEYNYIELADINKANGMVENTTAILGKDLPSRARMGIEKGCALFSSLEGSIDKVAIVDIEKENLVASTGFFVFKENILNKETLLVLLKYLGQKYISREALGTIMSAISNNGMDRIVLPKVKENIQEKIKNNIHKSFEMKNKSKELLELAKKMVEVYIEKDEEKAMELL